MTLDPLWLQARQAALEGQRANFDSRWQQIAEYVVPQSAAFTTQVSPGTNRMTRVFDSTAIMANVRFAAAMQSMLTPSTQRWHQLVPSDPALAEDHEVRVWCDAVVDRMFAARYAPRSQFGQAIGEAFLGFGAFGNMVVEPVDDVGRDIVYRAWHPSEFYFVENALGVVDAVHRKFRMSARAMAGRFGKEALPVEVARSLERDPDTLYDVIHVVMPYEEAQGYGFERKLPPMMRYASCYYSPTGRKTLSEGGFRVFPFGIGRYQTHPGEVYGRGPGDIALPDVRMLNEMMKTHLRAAHRVVDPPLLLPNDGVLQAFNLAPAALNFGGMSSAGAPLVRPLETGGRLDLSFEMMDGVRKSINDVFHVSLFTVLVDKPTGMTATEAMIRAQEKGALLAPIGQRAQGEFLGGIIARELDILGAAGMLPPMPDVMAEAGGLAATKVEYAGPINKAQKAEDGAAAANFMQMLSGVLEMFPDALDRVDSDELVSVMADVTGLPDKVLRDMREVVARRADKQQRADASAAVQAAPLLGAAAKDLTAAQAQAAAAGPRLPLPTAA